MNEQQYIAKLQNLDTQGFVREARRLSKALAKDSSYDPEAFDNLSMLDTLIEQADNKGCYETVLAEFDKQGYDLNL
jgi:hypothetical protein